MKHLVCISGLIGLALTACKVDPQIKKVVDLPAHNLIEVVPQGWPQPVYTFTGNPITQEKFVLGRALFYEPMLSVTNDISCGFCHTQVSAFSDKEHDVSHGINQQKGVRNAPGIFNANWHPYFMHDGGVINLELQPVAPITNPIEMGETMAGVVGKLQASRRYRQLFFNAYGSEEVTSQGLLKALAQFMGLMYSYNSKYDQVKRGENNASFDASEQRGYSLFQTHCNSCHTEPLFTDFKFRSNGMPVTPVNDSGRAHIDPRPENRYTFKTPSLRNVEVTLPYMHDGSYTSLQKCLDHYTKTKPNTVNLDPLLLEPMVLSAQDKTDLIAFLKTLTDHTFLNDRRFADPNQPNP